MSLVDALRGLTSAAVVPPVQEDQDYEPPVLDEHGLVRAVVLGNSSSGNGDANSQYYW